jgi:uncharacterized protein YjbI with pentapeptide repeats
MKRIFREKYLEESVRRITYKTCTILLIILHSALYSTLSFKNQNLANMNFTQMYTENQLVGADFSRCTLTNCSFRGMNLTGANFTAAILTGSDLTKTDLTDAILINTNVTNVISNKKTNLEGAVLLNNPSCYL